MRDETDAEQMLERTGARASVWIVTEKMKIDLQSMSAPPAPVAHLFRSATIARTQ